jgi:hypothetical protein
VNGGTDDDATNNTMQSYFATAPDWLDEFTVVLMTNKMGTETKWRIETLDGGIVKQQNAGTALALYTDTIKGLPDGCYRLVVTDDGCDGLSWWANPNAGNGYLYVAKSDGTLLPLSNGLPAFPNNLAGDFGCGYTQYFRVATTLPASQLSLSGTSGGAVNHLTWQTPAEVNTSRFDIQYSTDDISFVTVGSKAAGGNTSSASNYSADHTPSPSGTVYYYRLKLFYTDGSYKYSNTITLKPAIATSFSVVVKPNPFTSTLYLATSSPRQQTATIRLFDVQGRVVYQENVTIPFGYNTITVGGLSGLSAGVYMIAIDADGYKLTKKLLK